MKTPEYRQIHKAGDAIEPRAARAFGLALQRLRARIPVDRLEAALGRADMRELDAIVTGIDVEDAFAPSGEILADAVIRGGKIAGEEIV